LFAVLLLFATLAARAVIFIAVVGGEPRAHQNFEPFLLQVGQFEALGVELNDGLANKDHTFLFFIIECGSWSL
jgi:hypothetical protein